MATAEHGATRRDEYTRADVARHDHRHVVHGLYWSALLLFLLALWVGLKHAETTTLIPYGIGLLCLAALGTAVGQTLKLNALRKQPDAAQEAGVRQQRGVLSLVVLGLSAVLVLLMLWLTWQAGRLALPELFSALVLAVYGAGVGWALRQEPSQGVNQDSLLDRLVRNRGRVMTTTAVKGLALVIGGGVLFYNYGVPGFPLAGAGVFLGLVLLSASFWLLVAAPQEVTATNFRVLVLIVGGAAGLIISLMTAVQFIFWQDLIFSGGMSAWREPEAWRYWLAVYVELFGLALMFGSLYLAQADIRSNALLRRVLYGYNAVFNGLLLLAVIVLLNVVVYASMPYSFNWTRSQGLYSLSNRSKQILEGLKEPTRVYVLMSQGSEGYQDVRTLLENTQAYSPRLRVVTVSPEQNSATYRQLLKDYPKLQEARKPSMFGGATGGRGLLVVYGPESAERPPHDFIPEEDLIVDPARNPHAAMQDPEKKQAYEFRGEDLVMTSLSFLASDQRRPVVYFSEGNGELNVSPQGGGSELADRLKKDNYQVRRLFWGVAPEGGAADAAVVFSQKSTAGPHQVPDDAKALVFAGPRSAVPKEVLDAVDRYMDRGGKLVLLAGLVVDPKKGISDLGLKDFLGKYGVELGNDFVLRFTGNPNDDPTIVLGKTAGGTAIAKAFEDYDFPLLAPRTVKAGSGTAGYRAQTLMEVRPRANQILWAETDFAALRSPLRYVLGQWQSGDLVRKQSREPLPVAVTVTDQQQRGRMVVFGNAVVFSDEVLADAPYPDLFAGALEWLAERPANIGIAPQKSNIFTMRNPQGVQPLRMTLLPFSLMLLGLLGLGLGVWVVRRR